jgi:hypothetical protein
VATPQFAKVDRSISIPWRPKIWATIPRATGRAIATAFLDLDHPKMESRSSSRLITATHRPTLADSNRFDVNPGTAAAPPRWQALPISSARSQQALTSWKNKWPPPFGFGASI